MGNRSSRGPDPPCLQKYGVPFFGAGWIPYREIRCQLSISHSQEDHPDSAKDENSSDYPLRPPETTDDATYVVLAGGGGEGHSGIPNAALIARFDLDSNFLSPLPVARLEFGSDCPYRMVVHPGGDGLICALPRSCRYFEWDAVKSAGVHRLGLKPSDKVLTSLEDIGQQLALAFNLDGSILAIGGEDGNLRVFRWPSMEVIIHDSEAHSSVKYLSFSPDGKFLISIGSSGPGRVWDLSSTAAVASLPKEKDEKFVSCGFALTDDSHQVLYIAAMKGQRGNILSWNATSWKRINCKEVGPDPICAFNVSTDGKLLAVGTVEGDVLVISSSRNMQIQMQIKKAHLGMVTSLAFSHDSRTLVSASMDSSARVTVIRENEMRGRLNLWVLLLVIILAIAAYFWNKQGILSLLQEKSGYHVGN